MITFIACVIAGLVVFAGGAVSMYFFLRNNPKYLNVDEMLKTKRDETIEALKKAGIEILSK